VDGIPRFLVLAGILSGLPGSPALAGEPDAAATEPVTAVVFSSLDAPQLRQFHCAAEAHCVWMDLTTGSACDGRRAQSVVVTGHSLPPAYLGVAAPELAAAIACLEPELVVLDTCYGFSEPLMSRLAELDRPPLVLGTADVLPPRGLEYDQEFFGPADPARRAAAVRAPSPAALQSWTPDGPSLELAARNLQSWDAGRLTRGLRRVWPNLVEIEVPGTGNSVLVEVAPERFAPP